MIGTLIIIVNREVKIVNTGFIGAGTRVQLGLSFFHWHSDAPDSILEGMDRQVTYKNEREQTKVRNKLELFVKSKMASKDYHNMMISTVINSFIFKWYKF